MTPDFCNVSFCFGFCETSMAFIEDNTVIILIPEYYEINTLFILEKALVSQTS